MNCLPSWLLMKLMTASEILSGRIAFNTMSFWKAFRLVFQGSGRGCSCASSASKMGWNLSVCSRKNLSKPYKAGSIEIPEI